MDKEPPASLVGRNQRSGAATFAAICQSDALFDHATAEVVINQTLSHFVHRNAQRAISQFRLAHPSAEVAGFEHAFHSL